MNILHIVYAKVWGGGEQYVYNFCKEQNKCGNKSFVVVDKEQFTEATKYTEVADVFGVKLRGINRFFCITQLLKVIDDAGIDVLNCHSGTIAPICILIKWLRPKVKLVIFKHNVGTSKRDLYHYLLQKTIDACVCVSKLVYELQLSTAYRKFQNKFCLITNGIDEDGLEFAKRDVATEDKVVIGYAGRITENKGILFLLEAAKLVQQEYRMDTEVLLCGELDTRFSDKFNSWIAENNFEKHIHFLGFVSQMKTFYNKIDVFILPSMVRESFGLVLCEAMYSGVPVITTNSGAQEEIVENGVTGFVVPVGNVEKIAACIKQLQCDRLLRDKITSNARMMVENKFTMKRTIDNMNAMYKELLAK